MFIYPKYIFISTSNVKDFIYKLYACVQKYILPRHAGIIQLHVKKLFWRDGIPHL